MVIYSTYTFEIDMNNSKAFRSVRLIYMYIVLNMKDIYLYSK